MMTKRQAAIRRRRLFLAICAAVLALIIAGICVACSAAKKSDKKKNGKDPATNSTVSVEDTRPKTVTRGGKELDATYTDLLLVNNDHPLAADYDFEKDLETFDDSYAQKGYDLRQLNKNVIPYITAMIDAARADGVELGICSPYRSYQVQQVLFNRQINRWKSEGYSDEDADKKAATVVARPGTSEHHTGLAADFVMSDDKFEQLPAFAWLQEHAAEYGFILRYPKEKEAVTGVIYEPWHYRFVGIYEAEKIKASGLCLEEYLEKNSKNK